MFYANNDFYNKFIDGMLKSGMSSPLWVAKVSQDTLEDEKDYEINYTKDGAYLMFEVPGFNKSNLNVELDGDRLTIEGKKTYTLNGKEKIKTISQKFSVGSKYDASQMEATVEDGILTVFVPDLVKKEKKQIKLL